VNEGVNFDSYHKDKNIKHYNYRNEINKVKSIFSKRKIPELPEAFVFITKALRIWQHKPKIVFFNLITEFIK
jgi:hypothetical protein